MRTPANPKTTEEAAPERCTNCGARLHGPYCHRCGQEARDRIAPIGTLTKDLLGELFNFDTRLFRTLKRLVFQPGRLTVEYIAGRRVGYVPPLRLFVFSSFLLFLLVGVLSTQAVQIDGSVSGSIIDTLDAQSRAPAESLRAAPEDSSAAVALDQNDPVQLSQKLVDSLTRTADSLSRQPTLGAQLKHAMLRGLLRADRNPRLFVQQAIGRLSGLAFALLPVFALLLKLFYLRSGRLYVEHLIFALHAHAFFFILMIVVTLVNLLGVPTLSSLFTMVGIIGPALFLLIGMRRVYGQGWIATGIKWGLLLLGYLLLVGLAVMLYTALTFMLM